MITKTVSTSMRIAISCAQLCSKTLTVVLKNQEVIDIERENKKKRETK